MNTDIRIAGMDDLAAIEAIVEAAYRPYIARLGRKPGPMHDDYAEHIRRGEVRVLDRNGVVCGLLVLMPQEDAMLLDNVAVAPAAQGGGVGRRLMLEAEDVAREQGFRSITLYTNVMMTENIALYERIGYAETERVEEKGLHRVYFAKPL